MDVSDSTMKLFQIGGIIVGAVCTVVATAYLIIGHHKKKKVASKVIKVSRAKLPATEVELFGRDDKLRLLTDAWHDPGIRVLSLIAGGGAGKTVLVNHWLDSMDAKSYRGAKFVFGWSFYSQGARETEATTEPFVEAALNFFGDPDHTKGSAWEKAERLAGLIQAEPTILVLDGLEPLQHDSGGTLKSQVLKWLLRELCVGNSGLCLITSRVRLADIAGWEKSTAPVIELEPLSNEAGAALLDVLDVRGGEEELEQVTREYEGHGLALTLLGTYLDAVHGGDPSRRNEVGLLPGDLEPGNYARGVMAAYAEWLGDGPELAVLRLMGLFDRPAEAGLVASLRQEPTIPGLTDAIAELDQAGWRAALTRLRGLRLLAPATAEAPDDLDAHPLVRAYFGERLRDDNPEAWRAGHSRLFDHLAATAEDLPETLEAMTPLFRAVTHGCAAGRHQEAYRDVYRRRIHRGKEFFISRKLGAFGSELTVLTGFFDHPWNRPVDTLSEAARGFLLNEAGIDLRAMGRLDEAIAPMTAALESNEEREDWKNAARAAGTLSELHLARGAIDDAVAVAERSVKLADDSGDAFMRMANRTILAYARNQAGDLDAARTLFEQAEAMQKEREPDVPFFYSLRGFHYCDLLLADGEAGAVAERAATTREWARKNNLSILTIALDTLSLGRARLAEADTAADLDAAGDLLDRAVTGLHEAGEQEFLARGLLVRAGIWRIKKDRTQARADLDEVLRLAERSGMRLFEADAHLEYARLHLDLGQPDRARPHFETARDIIAQTGYRRRDPEVAELEQRLA